MEPGPADLELVSFLTTSALPQVAGSPRTRYHHRTFFVGSEVRDLAGSGQLEYVPISLEEIPRLLTSGRLPIDVAFLQVSRLTPGVSSASGCPWILRRQF